MIAKITPSTISGSITAPPSKSMAHRYIICASLADGISRIDNITYSDDISATLDCVEALGASVTRGTDFVIIKGINPFECKPYKKLSVNESGSTLRFMIPIALLCGEKTEFTGKERLFLRPLEVYEDIAQKYGFQFTKKADGLTVCGKLKSGIYHICDNKSSQFISGLLFALPVLSDNSEIVLESFPESKPYIDMTIQALKDFGVSINYDGEKTFKIPGNQSYGATDITVEGDCSNAAFFEALNILGGNVKISGIRKDTLQGDIVYLDYFEKIKKGNPTLDITNCPDLAPILLTLLADNDGGKLTGTKRLKFKESDRGEVMKRELSKFGAKVRCFEDEIIVENVKLHAPTEPIMSNSDHRVVMSAAVLMTKYGGEICGCEDCRKSMPEFFERLSSLGGSIVLNN